MKYDIKFYKATIFGYLLSVLGIIHKKPDEIWTDTLEV